MRTYSYHACSEYTPFYHINGLYHGNYSNEMFQKQFLDIAHAILFPTAYYSYTWLCFPKNLLDINKRFPGLALTEPKSFGRMLQHGRFLEFLQILLFAKILKFVQQ